MSKYIDADLLRSEIERQVTHTMQCMGGKITGEPVLSARKLLAFLDTLPEQPVEGLEEEIEKVCRDFVFPLYGLDDEFGRELINRIARHFAEWGAEHLKK